MKAMIFAAGKGTRLKPLTDNTPKALIKVNGTPMIELVIKKLISIGVREIIINVHHFANQIINFLNTNNNFGIKIEISDESDKLLDTGGGLKKASWFFDTNEPFILHNTDIISDIDLLDMIAFHKNNNALATLAVRKRESNRYFLFNNNFDLCGWENIKTTEKIISKKSTLLNQFAFSGIHIINPIIFNYLNQTCKFSIVNSYLELSKNKTIKGFDHTTDYWFDVGDTKKLEIAKKHIRNN